MKNCNCGNENCQYCAMRDAGFTKMRRNETRRGDREIWKDPCPISGRKWPCARHELCTWCTNEAARHKAAALYRRHEMIGVLKPWLSVAGELTKTLPGSYHGIRRAGLAAQYKYFTKRSRNKRWMKYLRSTGASGGIEFLEITQNSETGHWNLHSHDLLYSSNESLLTIPPTPKVAMCAAPGCNNTTSSCNDDMHLIHGYELKNGGAHLSTLKDYGWGSRYSYDPDVKEEIAIGYLTKLAYAAKPIQFSKKIQDLSELSRFFYLKRPRLTRVWGDLRVSKADRTLYDDINN